MTESRSSDRLSHRVAFLGLGVMGSPMAGHLAGAGHQVTVYNRSADKAARWTEKHAGTSASTPAAATKDAQFVMVCVGDDPDVRDVVLGANGALESMSAGSVLVDHTTASAQLARELASHCEKRSIGFVDAPISGGQVGAETGQLTIMCGGEQRDFDRARPVLDCYAKAITRLGPAGSGQLTKMVNQICIAGLVQGLSEGIAFAERAGLDPLRVVEAISKGAAQSWQMDNRHETMVHGEFDHGFAVEWMRKDLGIALSEARRVGASLPVTALVDQFYAEVERLGGTRWDTSALIERLRRLDAEQSSPTADD